MCFDGAVGAARGLHGQQRLVLSLSPVKTNINGFVLLIVDIVARCRQNRRCGYVVDFVMSAVSGISKGKHFS